MENNTKKMSSNTKKIAQTGLLLAMAIVFQIIGRNIPSINQFFVGPMINCILILTAFICGIWWGAAVGVLTPLLAYFVGQLAAPMAPFIPFIMVGNLIFVFVVSLFLKGDLVKRIIGVIVGALCKYGFMTLASRKLVVLFGLKFPPKVAKALAINMSLPQLITALIGGGFALIIIQLLIKRKVINNF